MNWSSFESFALGEPDQEASPEARQPGRVLIADDEPFFSQALAEMLEDEGIVVSAVVTDGERAVQAARTFHPDVIVMDLRMPVLDGLEAALRIRAVDPLVQILMLSAYEEAALRQEASEAGVYCYLVKGCRPELVIEMVHKALDRRRGLAGRPQQD